jgi:hypothetical protein
MFRTVLQDSQIISQASRDLLQQRTPPNTRPAKASISVNISQSGGKKLFIQRDDPRTPAVGSQRDRQSSALPVTDQVIGRLVSLARKPSTKSREDEVTVGVHFNMQEEAALMALECYNRQYYLAGFDKNAYELPARQVFPSFDLNNRVHLHAVIKTKSDYKNWRQRTLKNSRDFAKVWIRRHRSQRIQNAEEYAILREALDSDFSTAWLRELFHFAYKAVDFENITELGLAFLKCKFSKPSITCLPNLY